MLIESAVYDHLKSRVSVPVSVGIPPNKPDKFVSICITGMGERDQIQSATIEISSYAKTKLEAATLNDSVRGLMKNMPSTDTRIMSCKFGGGNDRPDTYVKSERYRSYFNIYY